MCWAPHLFLWRLLTISSKLSSKLSLEISLKTVFKIVTWNCQLKIVFNDKIVSTSFTPTSADNLLKHRHSDQLEKVLTDWPIVADWFLITRLRLLSSKFCLKKCLAWFSFFFFTAPHFLQRLSVDYVDLTGGTVDCVDCWLVKRPACRLGSSSSLRWWDKADSLTPRCLSGRHSHPAFPRCLSETIACVINSSPS